MLFRTLVLFSILITSLSFAQGRGPAVEDFVGIDIEHPEGTPQGTEGLFNFEQAIHKFENQKTTTARVDAVAPEASRPFNYGALFGISLILALPLLTWVLVMNHFKKQASLETAANIEVLEKYRRERELARKAEEEIKKAS